MNETKIEQKPALTRFQRLKMKIMKPAMAFTVAVTAMMSSASAATNFTAVTEVIDGIVPVFSSLKDLIVAAVPVILTIAVVTALIAFIKRIFGISFKLG